MNKGLIILFVILGFLILGSVVTILIIANQKGWFGGEDDKPIPMITLYLKSLDKDTLTPIEANYAIDYNEGVQVAKGRTTLDFSEIQVPSNQLIKIYCWNDDHYLVKVGKIFTPEELANNKSSTTCDMVKIGNMTVSHVGSLANQNNQVSLDIATKGWIYKLAICATWSAGIIDVNLADNFATCDKGNWLNWTSYNASTKQYTYLPAGFYHCGDDITEECTFVDGNTCKMKGMDIPLSLKNKADECWYIGKGIHNDTLRVDFDVKAENQNQLDYVKFYIMDEDRRFSVQDNYWIWLTEENGQDIGAKNVEYQINYLQGGQNGN